MAEGAECGWVSLTPEAAPELAAAAFNICPALQQAQPDAAGCRRVPLPALKAGLCLELGEFACLHTASSHPGAGKRAEGGTFSIDWLDKSLRYRLEHPGAEALVRACLNRLPEGCRVWDATAGLGRDSLILASRGAQVTMFERHAVVYLLLLNAYLRAYKAQAYSFTLPKLIFGTALDCAEGLKARLGARTGAEPEQAAAADVKAQPAAQHQLLEAPATSAQILQEGTSAALSPAAASGLAGAEETAQGTPLAGGKRSPAGASMAPVLSDFQSPAAQLSQLPQVIYYDPMFPERRKSAKVKKEMQVFHLILGSDADTLETAEALSRCCTKRLVIKRPAGAPPVQSAILKPAYSVDGGGCRFDCYLPR